MSEARSVSEDHRLVPIWIRGELPEVGNREHLVTRSETEAALWGSQDFPVTQAFVVEHVRRYR